MLHKTLIQLAVVHVTVQLYQRELASEAEELMVMPWMGNALFGQQPLGRES